MKSILDPAFKYVPAAATDLRRTFARIRREMKEVKLPGNRQVIALTPKDKRKA